MEQVRVLIVCSGNICRSPLAELMLAAELRDVPDYVISSAGTVARDGDPMPREAQALADRFGVDPTHHRARFLTEQMVTESDLLFGMSRSHRGKIVAHAPSKVSRSFTLREFARLSSMVPDEEVARVLSAGTLRGRVDAMVRLVFEQKGSAGPMADPMLDDVVDPYKRDDETYRRSGEEIAPAVRETARMLRLAAGR